MAVTIEEYIFTFVIGLVTSGALLFGSYVGLKDFQELPKRLFKKQWVILFVLFGGFFAYIFQIAQPNVFLPFQAIALGATWPAIIIGIQAPQISRDEANKQSEAIRRELLQRA